MKGSKVASRYAKALLDLAIEQNVLEAVNTDMRNVHEVLVASQDLAAVLKSPVIAPAKKVEILESVFTKNTSPMTLGFMKLIVKKSRAGLLPEITESFISLYKKHNNILDVYLTSAVILDQPVKEKILAKIKSKFPGTIHLIEKVEPELLGGFVIRIDDNQIDASISNQLTNLKNILLN
jgi:F-type H+-transporting ATPase subunit delta